MNSSRGFTLLELLIGMTLLGFMLALLFAGFRLASDSWDAVDRRALRTTDEEIARALVRRLVTQLQPMRWKRAINQPLAFTGEPGGFRALAPLSGQAGLGGLRVIELTAEREPKGGKESVRLVLRQAPLRYDVENFSDGLAQAKDHTVLNDLVAVQFGYFGVPKAGEPAQWFDVWPNTERLPQLMRVRLESRDAGWSDLLITPMIGGEGCHWNAFYKKCMAR
jgi:general secretion pathway protein J